MSRVADEAVVYEYVDVLVDEYVHVHEHEDVHAHGAISEAA